MSLHFFSAFLPFLLLPNLAFGWPDGAPCLRTVYQSMNPLEAVEHQGGLQLTDPPFTIEVESPCYNPGQPISLILHGNGSTEFKGFAMQPLVFEGFQAGMRRTGQFVRMDDNGSWQFQCFRLRDSITHSHDDHKGRLPLWWRGESTGETVQFVATVVQNLKRFWVKSVLSPPIPPCSQRQSFGSWNKGTPTVPPPTDNFKKETFEMFNPGSAQELIAEFSAVPREGQPRFFPRPNPNIADLPSVFFRTPPTPPTVAPVTFAPRTFATFAPVTFAPAVTPSFFRPRQQFQRFGQNAGCRDTTSTSHCLSLLHFCPTNAWMAKFCKATCRMC